MRRFSEGLLLVVVMITHHDVWELDALSESTEAPPNSRGRLFLRELDGRMRPSLRERLLLDHAAALLALRVHRDRGWLELLFDPIETQPTRSRRTVKRHVVLKAVACGG